VPVIDLPRLSGHVLGMNCDKSPFSGSGTALVRGNQSQLIFLLTFVWLALGGAIAQADWPEFRGPWGDGHASAPGDTKPIGLPLHWSETNNVTLKTEIPYRVWSTPVVLGGQGGLNGSITREPRHDLMTVGRVAV